MDDKHKHFALLSLKKLVQWLHTYEYLVNIYIVTNM